MSNATPARLNAQISEEAAEWFVDFRLGDVDAAGRSAFEAWVRSSPEHLRAYLEYAALWNEGDAIDGAHEIDVDALIASAQGDADVVELTATRPAHSAATPGVEKAPWKWAIAATVVIGAGVAAFAGYRTLQPPHYATDFGEQRSIRLADGSTVELNSRSRLRVRFDEHTRLVELEEGQALFRVARDAGRAFIVRNGDTEVRAVGTEFDVNLRRAAMVVTVLEGKVAVSDEGRRSVPSVGREAAKQLPIFVSAGEQISLDADVSKAPAQADIAAATAWRRRQLILKSAPLSEVAEEFNRYSGRKLIAEEQAGEELRLSGVFATDPDFLVRYLRARPDITVVESDSQVRIIHRSPR